MKKFLFLAAAGSMVAVAAPAAAQDATENFSGFRLEALVGYDNVRPGSSVDLDNVDDFDQSIHGVTYGVGIGFDIPMGGAVLGLEGEWMQSEAKTEYDTVGFTGFGVANAKAGRDLYLGARAGFVVSPNALVYVKGGYTNARFDVLATDNVTDIQTDVDLDGWRAGAGVELALTRNVFLKAEYRYSNYGKGEAEAPSGLESDRFDVDLDRHQGVVGVGVRF